jgi:D-sedoheptulose 7-phosphate isomerase
MNEHLQMLFNRRPETEALKDDLLSAFQVLREAHARDNILLIAGNGGSAADAEHWAGELLKGFCSTRPLNAEERKAVGEPLGGLLQRAIRCIPLTSFPAFSTAFGNDVEPSLIFAQLVWALGRAGDVFVGISTSGNANNVCQAATAARARGMAVIGLTGQDGGAMRELCDICIRVPAKETYQVQELHLPVYHCLSRMLEDEFFKL